VVGGGGGGGGGGRRAAQHAQPLQVPALHARRAEHPRRCVLPCRVRAGPVRALACATLAAAGRVVVGPVHLRPKQKVPRTNVSTLPGAPAAGRAERGGTSSATAMSGSQTSREYPLRGSVHSSTTASPSARSAEATWLDKECACHMNRLVNITSV